MNPVSISVPEITIENGWHVASSSIAINGKTFQIKYRASEGPIAKGSEPFLAAALLPSMKVGQGLQVSGTVSPKLFEATQTIQDIFHKWFPEFQKIPIQARPNSSSQVNSTVDVGAFFSGGVDSFYTLLKHQDEIDKIILIHGFNQYYSSALRTKVTKVIRQVAQDFGKPLIEVETNVREFSDQYVDYTDHFVGCMLESVGLLLSPQFRKIFIPGTFTYADLHPAGTHPLVDPLWSTEHMTFTHDGCEASRAEKTARIAESDIALRSLRVCFSSKDDHRNCGQCEKCIRTMLGLQAAGALDRCTTFNQKLDIEAVSRTKMGHPANIYYAQENLKALEDNGNNADLVEALRLCIKNNQHDQFSSLLNTNLHEFLSSGQGAQFVLGKKNMLFKSLWQNDSRFLFREVFKEKLKDIDQKYLFGILRKMYASAKSDGPDNQPETSRE